MIEITGEYDFEKMNELGRELAEFVHTCDKLDDNKPANWITHPGVVSAIALRGVTE